ELFLGLRKGPVPHHAFAPTHAHAGGRGRGLERRRGDILARDREVVRQLGGFAVTGLPLVLAQGLLVQVDQQHVSHVLTPCPPLPSGEGGFMTSPRRLHQSRETAPPLMPPPPGAGRRAGHESDRARTRRTAGTAVAAR